jgi:hypothetical protein
MSVSIPHIDRLPLAPGPWPTKQIQLLKSFGHTQWKSLPWGRMRTVEHTNGKWLLQFSVTEDKMWLTQALAAICCQKSSFMYLAHRTEKFSVLVVHWTDFVQAWICMYPFLKCSNIKELCLPRYSCLSCHSSWKWMAKWLDFACILEIRVSILSALQN